MENCIDKVSSFIEDNKLDKHELSNIAIAICMADKLYSKPHSLSYDILTYTTNEDWRKILGVLCLPESKSGRRELYEVDKYALLHDVLLIYSQKGDLKFEGKACALEASFYVHKNLKYNPEMHDIGKVKKVLENFLELNSVVELDEDIVKFLNTLQEIAPNIRFKNLVLPKRYEADWLKTKNVTYENSLKYDKDKVIKTIASSIVSGLKDIDSSLLKCLRYTSHTMELFKEQHSRCILNVYKSESTNLGSLRRCLCNKVVFTDIKQGVDINAIDMLVLIFYSENIKDMLDKKSKIGG